MDLYTWWHALEAPQPTDEAGCSDPPCSSEVIDLYCEQHDNFLPLGGDELSRVAWGGVVATGAVVYVMYWLAAELHSPVPLFIIFVVGAGVLVDVALRRLPTARSASRVVWPVVVVLAATFGISREDERRWLCAAAILVTGLLWVIYLAVHASHRRLGSPDRLNVTAGATLVGVAAAAVVASVAEKALPANLA